MAIRREAEPSPYPVAKTGSRSELQARRSGPFGFGLEQRLRGFAAVVALLLAAHVASAAAPERTLIANPPKPLKNFVLTDQHGKSFGSAQLRGTPALVFFGFTHCPTVCPAALQQLRLLERDHARELGSTRIVVVSVDGERDTPHAMRQWLDPVSKKFIGITGPSQSVRNIAAQFSAAFYKTQGKNAQDYLLEHNAQIFLIDAQGRLRATFFNAPIATIGQVTQSVAAGE
jgi:protein SCO1/2